MTVQSAQSVTVLFSTRVFSTGVGTIADSLPTGVLYVNGVSNAATVTVTNISGGLYKAQVTLPTLAVNDQVSLAITATVSSVTDTATIWGDSNDMIVTATGLVNADTKAINAVTTSPVTTVKAVQGLAVDGVITTVTNQLTAAAIATGIWTDITAGDFTTANSIGKSILNGVTLGTGLTVNILTTNSDKTGYALTSAYDPAKTASQAGDIMKVSSGTGANQISLASGTVTVGTNNDKTGYTASTVSDKTGYSLTQTFPTNFSALGIGAGGHITNVDTITTYTGNTPQTADVADLIPDTLVMTSGKVWALDGSGNPIAPASATTAIQGQTDQLVFTTPNQLDVNVISLDSNDEATTKLSVAADTMVTGSAVTGTLSATTFTTDLGSTVTGAYIGRSLIFISGTLIDQAQTIQAYTNTGQITVAAAFTTAPSNSDNFIIV